MKIPEALAYLKTLVILLLIAIFLEWIFIMINKSTIAIVCIGCSIGIVFALAIIGINHFHKEK
jgi:hypothetical protein